ncbi:hypothetical protein LCGC14_1407750 [marine sediment metagenome]|uniref:YopX protein domain-containing protein n=1 Tax=marine sediment metagenome TaxID=412755 RepID=A0A0F9MWU6_9ZZZZ
MREIKFRVWNNLAKEMIHTIQDIEFCDGGIIIHHGVGIAPHEELVHFACPDCILLEYTGLRDKNGVEIYEGDIVRYLSKDVQRIVEWDDEEGGFALKRSNNTWAEFYRVTRMEVIGNIYENSELL